MAPLKTRTVPAISKAFGILERIADSEAGLTLPELIACSGLAKSSVHYLLVTLERCGCVQRDGCTGRYVIGQKILKMARPS